jgi:GNAT superfamily N-acetyltransferase
MKIIETTEEEIAEFEKSQWRIADFEHYGREIAWEEWESKHFFLKAIEDEKIMGIAVGKCKAGVVSLQRIIVDSSLQSKGVGTELIKRAEEWSIAAGAHKIQLSTGKHWKANTFYQKMGFTVTAELLNHYFGEDFVIYTKFL